MLMVPDLAPGSYSLITGVRSGYIAMRPVPRGVRQAAEHGLVQQLVAQAPVEALDEAVLHRFARCE
jgi:hypothetical protein